MTSMKHRVTFTPSGRSVLVSDAATILDAAILAGEPVPAECGGRGACGRCLVRVLDGVVPDYRVLHRAEGRPEVLACLTSVAGSLTVFPLVESDLPRLTSRARNVGVAPLLEWAPWPLALDPIAGRPDDADLGAAVDVGTTTLRLLLVRLDDGRVVGEAGAYNPQIARGADVISRIVAAERGLLTDLAGSVRGAVAALVAEAAGTAGLDPGRIGSYVVAGNMTMVHLLLGEDPSGIRQVPSSPRALSFEPAAAASLGWPGVGSARVWTVPAAGGWVGGDIVAGIVRAGLPRAAERLTLYVDLGTNGEIALGGADFALACACSAGPAFEGGGIRCGMRADRGAIDGARIDEPSGRLDLSVIGCGRARGICGSGLIALAHALFTAGWIDRGARITARVPRDHRIEGAWGGAVRLTAGGEVALWERDLASLVRAKAAIFAGIRTLAAALGEGRPVDRVIVSGNFGRYLNLPAAVGIGLLPEMDPTCYGYIDNGALEGAALMLLSRGFASVLREYLARVTYVDLADLAGYMDEFVAASFLPHTSPETLRL
jgi:uncharacterized 2Fe-2S/4Fe-4S cluster protein (DUF4445 family)